MYFLCIRRGGLRLKTKTPETAKRLRLSQRFTQSAFGLRKDFHFLSAERKERK
jgi:hypothetical protein